MQYVRTQPKRRINTTISTELARKLEKRGIGFHYALSKGARMLIGEEETDEVGDNIDTMKRKVKRLTSLLYEQQRQIDELSGDVEEDE